jgi:FkbM family methyltransferase
MTTVADDTIDLTHLCHVCRFDGTAVAGLERPGIIYEDLRRGRFYEQEFLDYIRSLDIRGVYVDIGACIGTHTVFFALLCPSTQVVAFEPRRHLFERVVANAALNGIETKVVAHQLGLSDRTEQVVANLDRQDVVLECRRLDDVVAGRVDVLKIDVEGMEPKVIAGASRLLAESRPRIFAEAGLRRQYHALVDALARHGYAPTGRRFNATPTWEFVHDPRAARTIRLRRLATAVPRRLRRWMRDATAGRSRSSR